MSNLIVGDKVRVNNLLQMEWNEEEQMLNQEAEVIGIEDFVVPIRIRFANSKIEEINQNLGGRMFDYFELDKIK